MKRQANILSSLISNFQTVEEVIATAADSEGSALKENAKWLDSIEGKTTTLKNSMQTLWNNTLNSDTIKFFLDLANAIVKVADSFGLLPTAVGAFAAYKFAAKGLREAFDSTSVSTKNLKQQLNEYLTQQLSATAATNEATAATVTNTTVQEENAAATATASAADQVNTQTSVDATVADLGQAQAAEVLANAQRGAAVETINAAEADKLNQQTSVSTTATNLTRATAKTTSGIGAGVGIFSKITKGATKAGTAVKVLGAAFGKAALVMVGLKVATTLLGKAWSWIDNTIHRAEKLKEEVEELQKTYKEAKKTFDDNITALTTSSDSSIYSTLEDEFERLTRGVDQYGNNISLTSDQYERYKEICEKIVGIQPSIAAGYDSATKAIGNNASVLSELIELQKIQARNDTENLISDENASKIAENARNDYKNAIYNQNISSSDQTNKLYSVLLKKFRKDKESEALYESLDGYDLNSNGHENDDVIEYILGQLGKEDVSKIAQTYYSEAAGDYDINRFLSDYADEIKANTEKFGDDYKLTLDNTFMDIEQAITSAGNDVKEAQDGLINDFFLFVPQGKKAGEYYDQLNDASKKFVAEWIKNDSQFKLSENQTDEAVTAHRDNIIKVVKKLADDNFTLDFEGEQITAQDFIDKFYNFDPNTVNWGDYKAKKQELFDQFWKQIGGADNEYGIKKSDLKVAFGIEFIGDEDKSFGLWNKSNKATETKSQISKMINKSEDELQQWLDSLPASKVQKFYEIEWNKVDNSNIKSFGDVEDELDKQIGYSNVLSVKTYSDLSETIENFNEIQSQTEGIVANNTEVTQEYKDSLVKLGIAEEDLNDCFDDSNPLLVKNAALLRKLVSQKKAEKQATVQAAKAQTQMQYKNTVNQLKQVVSAMQAEYKANGMVSNSTLKTVGVLRSQLTELKQTVQQYALLELKLTEAANAYDEFEAAKNRDAELSYGDSMVEMLEAINEGFKTGKTGSDTFQAAVKALVPESVYADIDDLEQRMVAIHDYIDKNANFADYFTIDDDGNFSIAYKNIEAFIKDSIDAGLFTGTKENFSIADWVLENSGDGMTALDKFANKLGITQSAALAMLTELEKYDSSWGNIVSDLTTTPLDRNINHATDALDEALAAQEAFIRSGEDLNSDEYKQICANVEKATNDLNTATTAAKNNAQQWTQLETVYASATGKIKLTQDAADQLARSLGLVDENGNPTLIVDDNGTIQLTQDQVDKLNTKKKTLEEPSIMQVQLQYDEIVAQIDELKSYRDKELTEDDRNEIKMKFGLQDGSDAEIDAKIAELTKERETITLKYQITQTTSEQETGAIEKLQDWETNGMSFSVNAQTDEAKGKIDELNTEKNKLSEPETTTYIVDGTGEFTVKSINDYWTKIVGDKSTTYTIYENTIATETKTNANNAPSSSAVGSGRPRVDGTAHAQGYWGATKTETALTGELGPEILVRNGRWTTIGENGAEFTQIKKGDIIFNHKQTEELLKNGYVTGRGKTVGSAYVSGTIKTGGPAYYGITGPYVGDNDVFKNGSDEWIDPWTNTANALNDAADSLSDSADDFEEVFDWIEVRIEEIDEKLSLLDAQRENAVYYTNKNNIIDQMINVNNAKLTNLAAGLEKYTSYAAKLLSEVPTQYRDAAQNGMIAITEFAGEANEATLKAIENYREWAQKVADLKQQLEETKTTIRDLAIEKFDNAYKAGDVRATVEDSQTKKLQNRVDYDEERGLITSDAYYVAMMENSNKKIEYLTEARKAMQKELDDAVKAGQIIKGSNEWYELIDQLYQVQSEIDEATIELEQFQNAINDLYWENFDELINRLDYLQNETQNLIDLMDHADMVTKPEGRTYEGGTVKFWTAEDVQWTEEGIASLGLYAQQMEIAEYKAKQYAEAIKDLEKDYQDGKYSESEYLEKLNELKDAQYENIEAFYDAQDAIKSLNEARIDEIKTGIEKQIDAYQELIDKQKEQLNAEKDLFDFQKSIAESQKNISDIQRKLAALANDNSASAIAQRKKLQAELAEAQADLENQYYDRSISDRQDALDKEQEDFENEKNAEIEKWEEYLENVEQIITDSLMVVKDNASGIYDTLNEKAQEYGLNVSDAIMAPWQDGALAVSDYQSIFDTAMSSTMDQLEALKNAWQEVIDKMVEAGNQNVDNINKENADYAKATKQEPEKPSQPAPSIPKPAPEPQYNTYTVKSGDTLSGIAYSKLGNASRWREIYDLNRDVIKDPNLIYPGQVFKIPKYAKGTTGVKKSGLVNIDELGEELVIGAHNGRLTYMEKGSGVVPADLTANLMKWGELNPQDMLDRNRPAITPSKSIVNTEINLDCSVGELIHIERCDQNTLPDVEKLVNKAFDKHMQNINNSIRRYSR